MKKESMEYLKNELQETISNYNLGWNVGYKGKVYTNVISKERIIDNDGDPNYVLGLLPTDAEDPSFHDSELIEMLRIKDLGDLLREIYIDFNTSIYERLSQRFDSWFGQKYFMNDDLSEEEQEKLFELRDDLFSEFEDMDYEFIWKSIKRKINQKEDR